jgi:hypothetical protein
MHGSAWQGDGVMLLRALADRLTREHYAPIISWPITVTQNFIA